MIDQNPIDLDEPETVEWDWVEGWLRRTRRELGYIQEMEAAERRSRRND